MRITVDDWHFKEAGPDMLLLDLFLDNGQHGLLEVNPLRAPNPTQVGVPEMIVFCEMPGEKIAEKDCPARWVARPPSRECAWSNVQIPLALMEQIKQRLGVPAR
mgnify:CR=1 FL=1|jgi:hypothetical protein